jgi:hypothetical protein
MAGGMASLPGDAATEEGNAVMDARIDELLHTFGFRYVM